jgi:predicted ribosome quality control (RQC) complex YloA/Tae2 family protein
MRAAAALARLDGLLGPLRRAAPLASPMRWPSRASLAAELVAPRLGLAAAAALATAAAAAVAPPPPPPHAARLPAVDYTALAACTAELQREWVPAKVEAVLQVGDALVALRLRTLTASAWLYLSWAPGAGYVGLSEAGPPRGALAEAFQFGERLNGLAAGLVLTAARLPMPFERVVQLSLADRPGAPPTLELFAEVTGRYSNLVAVDAAGAVAAAGHQVGGQQSSLRQVQQGRRYALPPPPPGVDPDLCAEYAPWRAAVAGAAVLVAGGGAAEALVRAFRGVSPALAAELLAAAGAPAGVPAAALDDALWARLHEQWAAWLARLASNDFACTSCPDTGAVSMLGALSRAHASPLRLARDAHAREQGAAALEAAKVRLQRALAKAVERLRRKAASLRGQGASPDTGAATQRLADLLMAGLHAVPAGAAVARVEDWDAPGTFVEIPLNAAKPPVATAEALYAKARKQRRAVAQVGPLIAEAEASLEYLREVEVLLGQLEGADDAAALRGVEAELAAGGYVKAPPNEALAAKAATKARRAAKRGAKRGGADADGGAAGGGGGDEPRRFTSPGGLTVLVGRNSRQNDDLTMRRAKDPDVWMHARGVPGAHVLLRVPPGAAPADADVQFAADLAAFYSKARTEGKAAVTCARPADLSKPRGARPGQVLVKKETVVMGQPGRGAAAAAGAAGGGGGGGAQF